MDVTVDPGAVAAELRESVRELATDMVNQSGIAKTGNTDIRTPSTQKTEACRSGAHSLIGKPEPNSADPNVGRHDVDMSEQHGQRPALELGGCHTSGNA